MVMKKTIVVMFVLSLSLKRRHDLDTLRVLARMSCEYVYQQYDNHMILDRAIFKTSLFNHFDSIPNTVFTDVSAPRCQAIHPGCPVQRLGCPSEWTAGTGGVCHA